MTNQLQTQKRALAALRAEYQRTQALREQAERSECLLGFYGAALAIDDLADAFIHSARSPRSPS